MSFRVFSFVISVALLGACGGVEHSGQGISVEFRDRLRAEAEVFRELGIEHLSKDAAALELGTELYATYCASCHGSDGRGEQGVTDLVAGRFAYGSDPVAIQSTISNGRRSEMPALGKNLGEVEIGQLVAYVQSLSSDSPASTMAERGQDLFAENCTVCHGSEGAGITELGAPSLRDSYWQHGDSMMAIRLAITRGLEAICPPQAGNLSAAEVDILTAYVMGLNESTGSGEAPMLSEGPAPSARTVR